MVGSDRPDLRDELAELVSRASTVEAATRRVVALCSVLDDEPTIDLIERVARTRRTRRRSSSGHQAALGAVTTLAASYFTHHATPGARLQSVEAHHRGVQFGLLWRLSDGELFADELTTGRARPTSRRARAETQAAAGSIAFGECFTGVRIIGLRSTTTLLVPSQDRRAS